MAKKTKDKLEMKGAGGKPSGGATATRTPDSLRSVDTVEMVIGLGGGVWQGPKNGNKSLHFGNTPLESPDGSKNFEDYEVNFRPGLPELTADYLTPRLGGTGSITNVGVQLSKNTAVVRQLSSVNIDKISLRLLFNALYDQTDDGVFTTNYDVKIEIKLSTEADAAYRSVFPDPYARIHGKTTSAYVKQITISVPRSATPYVIRITQLSDNSTTTYINNVVWESYIPIIAADRSKYANTATLQVVAKATNQFTSIPEVWGEYETSLIRVPSNYNPTTRTYTGTWDGTFQVAFSDNNAWVLYDMLMNPIDGYSAYRQINCNKYDFYEAGVWCDTPVPNGQGGYEPRYTFNGGITEVQDAMELVRFVAGTFNATVVDDNNGTIELLCDRNLPAIMIFNRESVSEEGFKYAFTPLNQRYNEITVSFINPDLMYEEDRRIIRNQDHIDQYGVIPFDFVAVACNKESEAKRRAFMRMNTALTETMLCEFTTNRYGLGLRPFDNILIADEDLGFGLHGRVKSLNVARTVVTLRDPLYLELGVTYTFKLVMDTETIVERTLTTPSTGFTTTLTLSSALPEGVPDFASFTLEGEGIGAPKPFRVLAVDVSEDSDAVTIACAEINRNKFEDSESLVVSEPTSYTGLKDPNVIPGPVSVTFTDTYSVGGQETWTLVDVVLDRLKYTYYTGEFEVYSRPVISGVPRGEFQQQVVHYGNTLINHRAGLHEFKILPRSSFGATPPMALVPTWEHTIPAKEDIGVPPNPVTSPIWQLTQTGVIVKWTPPAGQEEYISHYLVKEGATEGAATIIANNLKDPILVIDPLTKRNYHLWIYSVAVSGVVADIAAELTFSNAAPAAPTTFRVEAAIGSLMVFFDRPSDPDIVGSRIQYRKVGESLYVDMDPSGLLEDTESDTAYEIRVAHQDYLTTILNDELWSNPRSVRTPDRSGVSKSIDEVRASTTNNLIRNGSFERDLLNWTSTNVTVVSTGDAPFTDPVLGTSKVAQMGDGIVTSAQVVSDRVVVRPNNYYTASASFKYDVSFPGSSHVMTLRVFNATSVLITEYINDDGRLLFDPEDISNSEYVTLSSTFLIPDGAVYAQLVITSNFGGVLFVDGVQLQRGLVATAFNPHVREEMTPEDLYTIQNSDGLPPSAPTGLAADAAFRNIFLTFIAAPEPDVAFYEIWRATTNDRNTATAVGTSAVAQYVDGSVLTGSTYYYWVRARDTSGNYSPFNLAADNGVAAQTLTLADIDFADLSILGAKIADATIDDAKIANLNVGKLVSGTIQSAEIKLGADQILLSAANRSIRVYDETALERVRIGKTGSTAQQYGIQIWDATGKLILNQDGLGAQVVGSPQMQDGSVTADKIVANAIDASKIVAGAVTAQKIATNSITAEKIVAGAVTANKLSVSSLSAITANLGTITAGLMRGSGGLAANNYWNLNSGAFRIGNTTGNNFIQFDPISGKIQIQGEISATNAAPVQWNDVEGRPTTLAGLDITASNKLGTIASGADVTSANIALNVLSVGGLSTAEVVAGVLDPAVNINQSATTINGNKITTGTIVANLINVNTLSALSANVGELAAGFLRNVSSTAYMNLDASGTQDFLYAGGGAFRVDALGNFYASSGSISGNLLVGGTITADKIVGGGLSNISVNGGSFNISSRTGDKFLILMNMQVPTNGQTRWSRPAQVYYANLPNGSPQIRDLRINPLAPFSNLNGYTPIVPPMYPFRIMDAWSGEYLYDGVNPSGNIVASGWIPLGAPWDVSLLFEPGNYPTGRNYYLYIQNLYDWFYPTSAGNSSFTLKVLHLRA